VIFTTTTAFSKSLEKQRTN